MYDSRQPVSKKFYGKIGTLACTPMVTLHIYFIHFVLLFQLLQDVLKELKQMSEVKTNLLEVHLNGKTIVFSSCHYISNKYIFGVLKANINSTTA